MLQSWRNFEHDLEASSCPSQLPKAISLQYCFSVFEGEIQPSSNSSSQKIFAMRRQQDALKVFYYSNGLWKMYETARDIQLVGIDQDVLLPPSMNLLGPAVSSFSSQDEAASAFEDSKSLDEKTEQLQCVDTSFFESNESTGSLQVRFDALLQVQQEYLPDWVYRFILSTLHFFSIGIFFLRADSTNASLRPRSHMGRDQRLLHQ